MVRFERIRKLIADIDIVPYPDKVLISKKRNPVYYNKKTVTPTLLKQCGEYTDTSKRYYFNEKGILIDCLTKAPVIKNKLTAGKPRYWKVNFQQIWDQSVARQWRANTIHKLEDMIRPSLLNCQIVKENDFPISIEIVIYDIDMPQDINNRGVVYHKVIADMLTKMGVIPDDKLEFLNEAGRTTYVPVDNVNEIGMQVLIYSNKIIRI